MSIITGPQFTPIRTAPPAKPVFDDAAIANIISQVMSANVQLIELLPVQGLGVPECENIIEDATIDLANALKALLAYLSAEDAPPLIAALGRWTI